jgi:4-amino-4-deoxy-L-arabinose transferase-like glycosyltransferase
MNRSLLLFILTVFLLIGVYTLFALPLGLDEAYYWYWAKHPALSYLDHPPMIAWVIALSTYIGGDREFWVRMGGFLLLYVGMGFGFATVRQLFPLATKDFAWEYLLILNLTLIFPGAALIQTPDTPLFAFWMMTLYFGARIIIKHESRSWYGLGLSLGMGMLSKYTMVLLTPGLLLFLILSPAHRYWLKRREPWLSALFAIVIWMPVLLWNGQHEWVSFHFQLHHGFETEAAKAGVKLLAYAISQAVMISPLLWLAFIWYSLRGVRTDLRSDNPACLYLTLTSWPVILFFAWSSAWGTQAEANWPAPAYLSGLLLAWAVLRGQLGHHRGNHRVAYTVVAFSLLLNLLVRTHLAHPWLPLSPMTDRLREFASWPALGQQIQSIINDRPHPTGWFLMGDKGTVIAEALFYTGNHYLGFDPARPERYLFLNDPNGQLRGKNAIIIIAHEQQGTLARFSHYFQKLTPLGLYRHHYRGQEIPRHNNHLYLGEEFLGNWVGFDRLNKAAG